MSNRNKAFREGFPKRQLSLAPSLYKDDGEPAIIPSDYSRFRWALNLQYSDEAKELFRHLSKTRPEALRQIVNCGILNKAFCRDNKTRACDYVTSGGKGQCLYRDRATIYKDAPNVKPWREERLDFNAEYATPREFSAANESGEYEF